MTREEHVSVSDIAQELAMGKATLKFILKRFKRWLPAEMIDGQALYPTGKAIQQIILIKENLDMGKLPSDIEKELDTAFEAEGDEPFTGFTGPSINDGLHLGEGGLALLKSFFSDIIEQQKRIAVAQEKRAFAEGKKIEILKTIATALQEMIMPGTGEMVSRPVDPSPPAPETEEAIGLDDLSKLVDDDPEPNQPDQQLKDTPTELKDDVSDINQPDQPLDDLSLLVDDPIPPDGEQSSVSDEGETAAAQMDQMDDLSTLVDEIDTDLETEGSIVLDDLSKLVDDVSDINQPDQPLDDLSQLIEDPTPDQAIDETDTVPEPETEEAPDIQIDISPEQDLNKYKAAVTKIIIGLKAEGLSVEAAADRLNKNNIKTLSGKEHWSQKAISQIYRFIESAT